MLHEYAVEPEALFGGKDNKGNIEYQLVWQALGQFGIEHGRMVSRFPKNWLADVKELISQMDDGLTKKSIEARLEQLRKRHAIMKSGRAVENSNQPWRKKAYQQHAERPFHAIIQADKEGDPQESILTYRELHEGNELWNVCREKKIPRTAAAIAEAVRPLGRISTEMLFIDPYFRTKKEYSSVFIECIRQCRKVEKRLQSIEVHTLIRRNKNDYELDNEKYDQDRFNELSEGAQKWILPEIDSEVKLKIVVWDHKPGGERFHARYILTNLGGLRIDYGLSEGLDGEMTDIVLMTHSLYYQRWCDFGKEEGEKSAFDKIKEFEFNQKN